MLVPAAVDDDDFCFRRLRDVLNCSTGSSSKRTEREEGDFCDGEDEDHMVGLFKSDLVGDFGS